MDQLGDLVGKNLSSEKGRPEHKCEKHGKPYEIQHISLLGMNKTLYFCDDCDAAQEHKTITEDEHEKLKGAMIGKRFLDKTFSNFQVENEAQRKAVEAAKRFLNNFENSCGLILIGSNGTGKNHIACAILREIIVNRKRTGLITTAQRMFWELKDSWINKREKNQILKYYCKPTLLVIDEVELLEHAKDKESLVNLTEVVNNRYFDMKPTILIADVTPGRLKNLLDNRIIDRFREDGDYIIFNWDSYRQKKYDQRKGK